MIRELGPEELRLSYSSYSFKDVPPGTAIIGQEKAIGLLSLGLRTDRIGYNIFLSGDDGSGRLTAVMEEIGKIDKDTSGLKDVAYAYSGDRSRPAVLLFPNGQAEEFQDDLVAFGQGCLSQSAMEGRWNDERIRSFLRTLPGYGSDEDAYRLNIVIDSGKMDKRPTVIEAHPSHKSLFGFADKERSSHLSIRIGSYQGLPDPDRGGGRGGRGVMEDAQEIHRDDAQGAHLLGCTGRDDRIDQAAADPAHDEDNTHRQREHI